MINDRELEQLLEAAHDAGARSAGYVLLRLPREVAPLFEEWLETYYPQRAAHVMSLIRQSRGGEVYNSSFETRMHGEGIFADLLEQRFRITLRRLGLNRREERISLDCTQFSPPGQQMPLF
jgi:DNA repair photolyase